MGRSSPSFVAISFSILCLCIAIMLLVINCIEVPCSPPLRIVDAKSFGDVVVKLRSLSMSRSFAGWWVGASIPLRNGSYVNVPLGKLDSSAVLTNVEKIVENALFAGLSQGPMLCFAPNETSLGTVSNCVPPTRIVPMVSKGVWSYSYVYPGLELVADLDVEQLYRSAELRIACFRDQRLYLYACNGSSCRLATVADCHAEETVSTSIVGRFTRIELESKFTNFIFVEKYVYSSKKCFVEIYSNMWLPILVLLIGAIPLAKEMLKRSSRD